MKPPFVLDPALYAQVLDHLSNLFFTDKLGDLKDMDFLSDDRWLSDTAVIDQISVHNGLWLISLVFAHHKTPMKFLMRRITSHACPRRAEMMALYMRRLAAKDQRGTLKIELESFHTTLN
ncbi:MAG: hypothetical protein HUU01_02920 [Saprospiraceae bacterium]|nr:hypothetical protein [Saprospiraceae bacterium]